MRVLLSVVIVTACACVIGDTQSQDCKDYVACAYKTGTPVGSLDSSYGAMGSCWSTTTAAADACITACMMSNNAFRSSGAAADAGCTL